MKNYRQNCGDQLHAINERAISAFDLLTELKPLLEDYFIGSFDIDEDAITYRMPNGQTFKLCINEIK